MVQYMYLFLECETIIRTGQSSDTLIPIPSSAPAASAAASHSTVGSTASTPASTSTVSITSPLIRLTVLRICEPCVHI